MELGREKGELGERLVKLGMDWGMEELTRVRRDGPCTCDGYKFLRKIVIGNEGGGSTIQQISDIHKMLILP